VSKARPISKVRLDLAEGEGRKDVDKFVNARGKTLETQPISPYTLDDIRALVEYPSQPTYHIETDAVSEDHLLDETTLEVDGDPVATEDNKRKWALYQLQRDEAEQTLSDLLLDIIIAEGVILEEGEPSEEWIRRRWKLFKGNVPGVIVDGSAVDITDYDKLKEYYVLRELVRAPTEIKDLMDFILKKSEIDEEVLEQARATFQRKVEQRRRAYSESDTSAIEEDVEVVS